MTRKITAHATRMAPALRREFGFELDVERLLPDEPYATEVCALAGTSVDSLLRSRAIDLIRQLEGLWSLGQVPGSSD